MEAETFFLSGTVQDERYRYLRDHDFFAEEEARQFVEGIWPQCRAYLDADFRKKASEHFAARFWEMYLVHTLLQNGIGITPRSSRNSTKGPDILLADGVTFIEAVLATSGCGRDAVPDPPSRRGAYSGLPDDQMKLRLLNAIDEKLKKYHRYRETGVLSSEDRYVIAVSGSAIGMARHELPIPRIVRAVFGLGNLQVHIDLESGQKDEWSWSTQEVVNKKSGAPVDSSLFLSPKSAPICAVIYCFTDECNRPAKPGVDFLTVHNPSASNKLARGFFPFGSEYWAEEDQIKWQRHPPKGFE